jgi:DNA-binding transcriptional ArsR family regulator
VSYRTRAVTGPGPLRALAHPLRQRLLEQLVLFGPLTATELADRVDESPSNCSWHLRKLEEHGFVEEAEGGTGRQRPWRASATGMSWEDSADDHESRLAGQALSRMLLEREAARRDLALQRLGDDEARWRDAAGSSQSLLWLTSDELAEINEKVRELLLEKVDRHEDASLRPAGARLCAFVAWGVPAYDLMENGDH